MLQLKRTAVVGYRHPPIALALVHHLGQRFLERHLCLRKGNAVLRAFRPGDTRLDRSHVERQRLGEERGGRVVGAEDALLLVVGLDQLHALFVAPRQPQVVERALVDREVADRRAVLGAHVGDRRLCRERQSGEPFAVELDELGDDAVLSQHLRHCQHEVGSRRAFPEPARELEADDVRDQHRHRLPEQRRLSLDAADAPAQDTETVDHRRMGVEPDQRVWIGLQCSALVRREDHARQVLEVDLVHDARVRRRDREVVEGVARPAQQTVALLVARHLHARVDGERLV